ncbi:PE family protein [Mycobacterium sp. 1245805.9]|uniref:PE family protein n=1 Tax=Mycobacterium sp. 1245805.9 TaxID=1856862 RepID=UPI0007FE6684|nr:PE family protein [Mycobacterium sp. 1245805.9]OBI82305.1 hypothetical protein A9X00_07990 [Mycobacterium sp. 1245805.9]
MSIINVAPECVLTAAGDLSRIGSAIEGASATAASTITAVVPPAADEVSAQLATMFTAHAQSYQAASAQAVAYHQEFAGTFAAAGARYALTEIVNSSPLQKVEHSLLGGAKGFIGHGVLGHTAGSALADAGHGPLGGLRSTVLTPGNALISPTAGLGSIKGNLPHHVGSMLDQARFPILHQILQNQVGYFKRLVGALVTLNPTKIWDAVKTIAQDLGHNVHAVWKEIFDTTYSLVDGNLHLPPIFALLVDAFNAPIETLANVMLQLNGILYLADSGHELLALGGLSIMPELALYDFLFGTYEIDVPETFHGVPFYMHYTAGGILTGAGTVWLGTDGMPMEIPTTGTPLGGLLGGLRYEAQQIANVIAPAAPRGVPSLVAPPEAPLEPPRLERPLHPSALDSLPPVRQP